MVLSSNWIHQNYTDNVFFSVTARFRYTVIDTKSWSKITENQIKSPLLACQVSRRKENSEAERDSTFSLKKERLKATALTKTTSRTLRGASLTPTPNQNHTS